jgi:alpha-L-rhamnosidase
MAETRETNLALGRPCKVFSSHEGDGWSVSKLTDGETGALGWSSKAFTAYRDHSLYPEFVMVDLGTNCALRRVVLYPRGDEAAAGKGFPKDFTIQVCREGEPWRVVVEKRDCPAPPDGEAQSFELEGAEGRYAKVEATRLREIEPGAHRFQLAEISVLGEAAASPALAGQPAAGDGPTTVGRLRCENRDNPVGIDAEQPRLSWWMQSPARGQRQTAYRVMVASSESLLQQGEGDLWDSGKITSDRSIAVAYGGRPLRSGQTCWWKVRLWDREEKETAWSEPAQFITGKLKPEDWQGQWIGADAIVKPGSTDLSKEIGAPIRTTASPKGMNIGARPVYLRKEIEVAKPARRATVFFSGLGFSELYLDGRKVGDYVVGPGFTTYNKRVQYLAFDVTDRFARTGRKALGVILVDGWYGNGYGHNFEKNVYVDKPKLRLNLHLEHPDGTETVVVSDESWNWADGEITCSRIVQEDIDRRRARTGWDQAGYDESGWRPAAVVNGPEGRLVHQKEAPCRVVQEIRPVSLRYDSQSSAATFDFGREFCGWVRFRTSGPEGTSISITTIPSASDLPRTSHFILAGTGGEEVYEPRFFYAGMRQVVIKGTARPPTLEDLTGCLVSMGWTPSGSFRCSDDLANWLNDAARRTVVAYTTWLPNDPTREFKAWMQDPQNMFWSSAYLFDSQTMYERWQWDIIDGQRSDGNSPNIAPGAYFDGYNSPWWGGCLVWLPWHWYQYYGDDSLLKDSYQAMKRYVDYLGRAASIPGVHAGRITADGLQDWGLADWLPIEETPRVLINTPAYHHYAQIVSRTAEMLGQREDARRYADVAEKVRAAFNRRFLDPATGIYGQPSATPQNGYPVPPVGGSVPHEIWWQGDRPCTQASQALPLALGLVSEEHRPAVQKALLREIAAHRHRVSTGFVSTSYLLHVLTDLAPEIGWAMTSARDYPSWYGMTAGSDQDLLKETWAGGQALMPSLGGNIASWHAQALAGVRPDPAGPGFRNIIIKPNVVGDLHWVESSYDSVYGRIVSNWRRRDSQLVMEVTIPANATATVYVPAKDSAGVTESGKPAAQAEGVKFLRLEGDYAVFGVGSGKYRFAVAFRASRPALKELPMEGQVFQVEGHTAFLILPKERLQGRPTPWVWYAPTLPDLPGAEERWMFERFLAAGIAIAGVDVGESYGSPRGRAIFSALHTELVRNRGMAGRACLLARSRGGLMLYNWACENPEAVACIAGIYPVCNLTSYPGVAKACGAYDMTADELSAQLPRNNPLARLAPLAKAKVPIFHIHGDSDAVVPLKENSGELAKRYHELGGTMELVVPPGQGHNMWPGFFQCKELVQFVIKHATSKDLCG